MPEMSDLKEWATNHADDDAEPQAPGGEQGEEQPDPADAYQHAANEVKEAIDALSELPDDDDSEWRTECVTALQEQQKALQDKVDEISGGDEEDLDEDLDDEETPEPEAV